MKRALPLILVCAGLLATAGPALGDRVGGHSEPTRDLEYAFKIVASERIASDDECYLSPGKLAAEAAQGLKDDVVAVPDLQSLQGGKDTINVVASETECNRVFMAIQYRGKVLILDSEEGPVYVQGREPADETSIAGASGALRDLSVGAAGFRVHTAHELVRLEAHCPGEDTFPLGGGMFTHDPIDKDGEGVYAHSYERLGAQRGFHVTPTFVTPEREDLTPRTGDLQVICGRGLVPTTTEHEVTFVRREGTGSVTSRCPEGTQIFSGGFQRTNFTTPEVTYGGNYITESRADLEENAWTVSAGATDDDGGELVAIAHCAEEDQSLPLTEVASDPVEVPEKERAEAVTPPCPEGRALIAGGFSFNGGHDALFGEGYFTRTGTFATVAYGWFGPAEMTAYGYCLEVQDFDRASLPPEPKTVSASAAAGSSGDEAEDDDGGMGAPLYAGLGAVVLALAAWLLLRRRSRSA